LTAQDLKLFALEQLKTTKQLTTKKAKDLIRHINLDYGLCLDCGQKSLKEEHTTCINCGQFNLNWKINQSFNSTFCSYLEFHLCKCFEYTEGENEEVKGFWCDGVLWFPYNISDLSKNKIKEHRKIVTKSWLGTSGQIVYEMTLVLGEKALQQYLKGLSMIHCLPDYRTLDWISIDTVEKRISLILE